MALRTHIEMTWKNCPWFGLLMKKLNRRHVSRHLNAHPLKSRKLSALTLWGQRYTIHMSVCCTNCLSLPKDRWQQCTEKNWWADPACSVSLCVSASQCVQKVCSPQLKQRSPMSNTQPLWGRGRISKALWDDGTSLQRKHVHAFLSNYNIQSPSRNLLGGI